MIKLIRRFVFLAIYDFLLETLFKTFKRESTNEGKL